MLRCFISGFLSHLNNKRFDAVLFGLEQRGSGGSSWFSITASLVWHEKMPQASQGQTQALKSILWKQLLMTMVESVLHFLQSMFILLPIYSKHLKVTAFIFLLFVYLRMQMYSLSVKTKVLNAYICIAFHGYGEKLEICIVP